MRADVPRRRGKRALPGDHGGRAHQAQDRAEPRGCLARRKGHGADQLKVLAVAPERLAYRQLEIGRGFLGSESVSESEPARFRAAGAIAAPQAQALEEERGAAAVAAPELAGVAERL